MMQGNRIAAKQSKATNRKKKWIWQADPEDQTFCFNCYCTQYIDARSVATALVRSELVVVSVSPRSTKGANSATKDQRKSKVQRSKWRMEEWFQNLFQPWEEFQLRNRNKPKKFHLKRYKQVISSEILTFSINSYVLNSRCWVLPSPLWMTITARRSLWQ